MEMTEREFRRLVIKLLIEIAKGVSILIIKKDREQSERLDSIADKANIDFKELL